MGSRVDSWKLGLDPEILVRMLDAPEKRPHPQQVVKALQLGPPSLPRRSKSRSRSCSPQADAAKKARVGLNGSSATTHTTAIPLIPSKLQADVPLVSASTAKSKCFIVSF